jgi:hypothetical protein
MAAVDSGNRERGKMPPPKITTIITTVGIVAGVDSLLGVAPRPAPGGKLL